MAKHRWIPDEYDDGRPDIFQFESGYCNGPRCRDCGRTGCHHCDPEMYDEQCPAVIDAESSEVADVPKAIQ